MRNFSLHDFCGQIHWGLLWTKNSVADVSIPVKAKKRK